MELVKSADVLDPTHEAKRAYRGEILGCFERTGANPWDDYRYVKVRASGDDAGMPSGVISVLPGVPLQLETRGPEVRMRSGGRVVRVRWLPELDDREVLGSDAEPRAVRQYFVEQYLVDRAAVAALGATAVIVNKIRQ